MADEETGRFLLAIDDMGEKDNTLVIYITGDNGTSAEGLMHGLYNEYTYFNKNMNARRVVRVSSGNTQQTVITFGAYRHFLKELQDQHAVLFHALQFKQGLVNIALMVLRQGLQCMAMHTTVRLFQLPVAWQLAKTTEAFTFVVPLAQAAACMICKLIDTLVRYTHHDLVDCELVDQVICLGEFDKTAQRPCRDHALHVLGQFQY